MIDTQEKNLPIEKESEIEETGELKTSQTPVVNPAETALVTEALPDNSVLEPEEKSEETEIVVMETDVEPETAELGEIGSDVENTLEKIVLDVKDDPGEAVTENVDVVVEPEADEAPEDLALEEDEAPEEFELEAEETLEELELDADVSDEMLNNPTTVKNDIIERLKAVSEDPKKHGRNEVDALKQTYYKMRRAEVEAKKNEFIEGGGDEADFIVPEDETEAQLRSLIAEYKEKRNVITADEERQKETNLIIKQHLIERLKILTESQDDFNKRYNEFRDIQRKWKEIRLVPQEYSRELWRNYQLYNERFYDIVKINNQFRDYDFKKNLEMKTVLCETVERLAKEKDAISAFHQLQKLHQQWREIGPVSKEHRESIWDRFKAASAIINKKQQTYYDDLKEQEEKKLERKEAICKELEEIDVSTLKTIRDWERKTEKVMSLQKKWRSIGVANRRQYNKLFDRFRAASDNYFNKKSEFYKIIRKETDKNLELKKALVDKAESLKTSEDWKETAKVFVELQNEWKKIGPVGRKYSETIWKQFIAACDYFFDRKSKESSSQKSEEFENLEAKKALIEKIKTIDKRLTDDEALTLLRGYVTEWNTIGYVPFKEKDKLHKSFREVIDRQFDRLKVNERDRRGQQFRSNQTEMTGAGKNKLYNDRDKLMRTFDRMKNELQTYENNIGFISAKGGDGLLKEIDRKIARLKEDMEVIVKKIEAIDENLD